MDQGIVNHCEFLDIENVCYDAIDIKTEIAKDLFLRHKMSEVSVNDPDGVLLSAIEENIRNYKTVRIYGDIRYELLKDRMYNQCGICIIISSKRLEGAFDTSCIFSKIDKLTFISCDYGDIALSDIVNIQGVNCDEYRELISRLEVK